MRHVKWIAVLLVTTHFGCSGGPTGVTEDVSLAVLNPQVALHDGRVAMSASVTVHNESTRPIGYATCAAGFQRLEADGWHYVSHRICVAIERRWINPGEQPLDEWSSSLPIGLMADPPFDGEYRFAAEILDVELDLHTVASDVFVVAPVTR